MSGEGKEALDIVIFALIGGAASKLIDSILGIPVLTTIATILLLPIVVFLLKCANVDDEIKKAAMIVAGVLIGVFISRYFDIIDNAPLMSNKLFGVVFICIWLYTAIYLFLKGINTDWVSMIRR